MKVRADKIEYGKTGFFSKIVLDYLNEAESLKPFYKHQPNIEGVKARIAERKKFNTNRQVLVQVLTNQYHNTKLSEKQQANLKNLSSENTFTVTTAHQPNIFTGPLYFIYKIVHAIKIADELKKELSEYQFVPVYYMGSEDADIEELGFINLAGEKLIWNPTQTGAVGRMFVDEKLINLINKISGTIGNEIFSKTILDKLKEAYSLGKTIQQATFEFVNLLFNDFGLLILIPDNAVLKQEFKEIALNEISNKKSSKILLNTVNQLNKLNYPEQTIGREINLFLLTDNKRTRIETTTETNLFKIDDKLYNYVDLQLFISKNTQLISPNVILRPLFQELVLPNILFVGGGGELAYWLELKEIFEYYQVPYPILVLRNSFLLVQEKSYRLAKNYQITTENLFLSLEKLISDTLSKLTKYETLIQTEKIAIQKQYFNIQQKLKLIDKTLAVHTTSLETKALNKISILEKKILKAHKRKHSELVDQIVKLKSTLFPNKNLQEREQNFLEYYAKYGNGFINTLYKYSNCFNSGFTVLYEEENI